MLLGVHKAAPANIQASEHGTGRALGEYVPAYVPRDIDDDLRQRLREGGFVLLVGDSTAGKTRAAFEAIRVTLADHLLICPVNREAVSAAVISAARAKRCVLWLDDLESYLGTGGLTPSHVGRLLTGGGHHRVVLATIRAAEQARITADSSSGDDAARQALRDTRQVIDQAHAVRMSRTFSAAELERARSCDWDPRVAEALDHADDYGVAEYLAAGPALMRDWEDARHSSPGPHARGAALVTAAVDIRRAGHTSAIPRTLLETAHEHYLTDAEHARIPREPLADAWAWATRRRHATTALLHVRADDCIDVLDYLIDVIQREAGAASHVPEPVVRLAIDAADPADVDSLAATAYTQGRFILAEHAWRQAWQAQASNPELGAEHVDTLTSRGNLANVLRALGRLQEAETHASAVLRTHARVLGAQHTQTLTSRDNLALVLRWLGRLDEAEAEHRCVLRIRTRVLGAEHPHTLASRDNLAIVLRDQGRLDEAEAEHRGVLGIRTRVLGAEHPHTLASRDNLFFVLCALGRLDEAEAGHQAVLGIRTRVLGAEHPHTLISRDNLAIVLRDQGRLDEAEAEHQAVLGIRTRVLGAEHPRTLTSRDNLAIVLRRKGRAREAETDQ
jgi:tetratricopeptide (TPR) repeat protein